MYHFNSFSSLLLNWFDQNGRKDLPWKNPKTPYRIFISEIMLQQTQVKTVIPYFLNFMTHFPDLATLATSPLDNVLAQWSGLGYYSRARNLHRSANIIQAQYQGNIPEDLQLLLQLPGIGPSTAAAITSQAFNKPHPILDGNVKRVLSRVFKIKGLRTEPQLWQLADTCMSQTRANDYTQAIMDLGALCCKNKNPTCTLCPLQTKCLAYTENVIEQYPEKKPSKKLPIKTETYWIIENQAGLLYVEQRPTKGIWGGLWCFPTTQSEHVLSFIQTKKTTPLIELQHSFTHFKLNLQSFYLKLSETPSFSNGAWFSAQHLLKQGIPKPMKTLLQHLIQQQ